MHSNYYASRIKMEPPSSVNSNLKTSAGKPADDPLSRPNTNDTYLVVTTFPDEEEEGKYVVCRYSPVSGLSYIGTASNIES